MNATRHPATGPWNGMSEIETAAEAAITAIISGGLIPSTDTHVGSEFHDQKTFQKEDALGGQ